MPNPENSDLDSRFLFRITVTVGTPVLVGQDALAGRRQLIPILSGELQGHDPEGRHLRGTILPGGIDSQVIRPDGTCELSARYGIRLDDGAGLYVENNGIRTVPADAVPAVLAGEFIEPKRYYFRTIPRWEVYDDRYRWLTRRILVCLARRLPESVELEFHEVM